MKAIRRIHVRTALPETLSALDELALNLHWSWHAPTADLFASIDPVKWEEAHHVPGALISAVEPARWDELAADETFVARVEAARAELEAYLTEPQWYQQWAAEEQAAGRTTPGSIAYFSPEFGITAALPQYSGGLGILAGDHLKSASDTGVPIVGVGLFYQTGYFLQTLNRDGWQQESYPVQDPDDLPLALVREPDGTPLIVTVPMEAGRELHAQVWRAQVGRVPLLLLDSNTPHNEDPSMREVTARLYGGGGDRRLQQEILLGVGGVRALRAWSRLTGAPRPGVYHTNEGHAGFLGVERIRELIAEGMTFDEALAAVRAGTVFTTHTPVPAGIDRFGRDQIERYLGNGQAMPGVPTDRLLALGAETFEGGDPQIFNMAVMGLRLAQRANGVSQLHGEVSREMFEGLWPGFDDTEVPITSITNGVHAPTWVDRAVLDLLEGQLGSDDLERDGLWERAGEVDPAALWATKRELRGNLVREARRRLRRSWQRRGASQAELGWVDDVLDPDVLTIGFARRVPTYKRLTLMLRDPERLKRLLLHPERPVQLIIAGKSHPADETGKRLIQQMVQFADQHDVRHRIVFLPNYHIGMATHLYPGCDVWLNNPLRPFEACGTSGMKAALNGGLNLSILDGWWDEWFDGENGWAIPTADGVEDADRRDDLEAAALYDLIETQVAPRFYDRDAAGLPQRWLAMMTHTLGTLGPKVLASRMVKDYTRQLYVPAARANEAASADSASLARELAAYREHVTAAWPQVRVEHVATDGVSDSPELGEKVHVKAFVALGDISADQVDVEVALGRASDDDELHDVHTAPLTLVETYEGGRHRFEGDVELARTGSLGYTVRVLPRHRGLANRAELGLVANA